MPNYSRDTHHLILEVFDRGLYGVGEMLEDGVLDLLEAGVIKLKVDGMLIQWIVIFGLQSMYQRLRELLYEQLAKINVTLIG